MNQSFYPCIWFDGKAKSAAAFYNDIFADSKILSHNPIVTMWQLCGQKFMGLDGGPMFKPNPSISFFVTCESHEEVDNIWYKLSKEAKIMMALDNYEWSEYYGFLEDKFGVSWQIFKGKYSEVNQKIVPCFLFTDNNFGKANSVIDFYTSVFNNSTKEGVLFYSENEMQGENIVKHAQFKLDNHVFMAMDGPGEHHFSFNEGLSFVIQCDTQDQIDYYWNIFTKDGGQESMCGWCKDKFGVSWQIVPSILGELMNNSERSSRVQAAFMQMKKFDIEKLLDA